MAPRSSINNNAEVFISVALFVTVTFATRYFWSISTKQQQQDEDKIINNNKSSKNATNKTKSSSNIATRGFPISEIDTSRGDNYYEPDKERILTNNVITIVHGSVTGTCATLAKNLQDILDQKLLKSENYKIQFGTLNDWDWWDELLNPPTTTDNNNNAISNAGATTKPPILLILLPTHHGGSWPGTTSLSLQSALQDLLNDWRIEKFPLRHPKLQVSVFGMGSSEYGDGSMGKPALEAVQYFEQLGAKVIKANNKAKQPKKSNNGNHNNTNNNSSDDNGKNATTTTPPTIRIGDDAISNHASRTLQQWINKDLLPVLNNRQTRQKHNQKQGNKKSSSTKTTITTADVEDYMLDKEPTVMDMEDLGATLAQDNHNDNEDDVEDIDNVGSVEPREMVTSTQAAALKKEGYKLIGTHSAVKLCRWTKHQLRGRGGCYKHSFYGITSYQCMEATPSLACANKCVFCWRHHKNPVGKEWKWKMDDPIEIVQEAVDTHVQMIKETKGIPGIVPERWEEAHTVRHCALSLVGEPIMYPKINDLLHELHVRHISTFLVTNGQHPKAISSLIPITQLYVSVDASTKESLIAIDRPLFNDAWERLQESLQLLKDKQQRTVARLTVVKGWNSDEILGYAKLIAMGHVSFVEVKGVTFCGKSDASNLNMSNTPWHHEVVELTTKIRDELNKLRETMDIPEYDLACEHRHSCSVLLARVDQFSKIDPKTGNRKWYTWIDYDKFQQLAAKQYENPKEFSFGVQDYIAETPAWALFGAPEEGFDPTDTRFRKGKKYPKYTKFDDNGIPTHDHNYQPLSNEQRQELMKQMNDRIAQIGTGTTVTEFKSGEKVIDDASLMFRGQVIVQ